jgi:WD40-like Beta Propeller Repeat
MWGALAAAFVLGSSSAPATHPGRIVFVSARTPVAQLYSVKSSGGGLAQLTFGTSDWGQPIPSPNGRYVAAIGGRDLWVMRPDGRGARRLAREAYLFAWSGDSKRLGYVSRGTVWTSRPNGKALKPVREAAGVNALSLSPNGRALALTVAAGDGTLELVVDSGGGEKVVAKNVSGTPAWSPDQKLIAILSGDGSVVEVVPAAGGTPRKLGYRVGGPYGATIAWSPDGRRLAYDDAYAIHLVSRTGGGVQILVPGRSRGIAWSPRCDAVATIRSDGPAVVTLDGRVRTLFAASPHDDEVWPGVGWTAVRRVDRYRAPKRLTPLVEVSERELRAHVPIGTLAADGDRVAYALCPRVLGVWRPGDAQQVALGDATVEGCRLPSHPVAPSQNIYALALAGDRLAYLTRGGNVKWSFMLTSLERGTEGVALAGNEECCVGPGVPPIGDVVGSGSTLVFGYWWNESPPESIWRLHGETPVQVARSRDGLQPVAVDEDRILARHPDGSLALIDLGGHVLETFAVPSLGATLAGDDLVVLVQGELREYSVSSGALLHAWPLPDVPSAGPCRIAVCSAVRLTLDGAARGLALYTLDGGVHLLRLRDGADATVPFALAAQLTSAGLFYSYGGGEPWPGHIRFVPFEELPL